jgi:hypothetical protein
LIVENKAEIFGKKRISINGKIPKKELNIGWEEHSYGTYFIMFNKRLLITEDKVFFLKSVDTKKKLKILIKSNKKIFDDFLDKYKTHVPHEVYIDWLIKWFPARIKLRLLDNSI